MTATDPNVLLMVGGFSVVGGVILHGAIQWARRNLGICRRCRNKRRHCYCMGGPR